MTLRCRLRRLEAKGPPTVCRCPIQLYSAAEPVPPLLPDGGCPECGKPIKGVRAIVVEEIVEETTDSALCETEETP